MTKNIIASIREYASAYDRFQQFQDAHRDLLPLGDQKTGVIGEFYARLYALSVYSPRSVTFEAPGNRWDITVSGQDGARIQVKTVSDYSTTRTISPLFPGWDHLYLIALDRLFIPIGFWIVTTDIFGGREFLRGLKMRHPITHLGKPFPGSSRIPFGENLVAELLPLIVP